MANTSLEQLRSEIDRLDDRLLELLNQRAGLARRIGRLKEESGRDVYDPGREALVLARLGAASSVLPPHSVREIFEAVIRACRGLQEKN